MTVKAEIDRLLPHDIIIRSEKMSACIKRKDLLSEEWDRPAVVALLDRICQDVDVTSESQLQMEQRKDENEAYRNAARELKAHTDAALKIIYKFDGPWATFSKVSNDAIQAIEDAVWPPSEKHEGDAHQQLALGLAYVLISAIGLERRRAATFIVSLFRQQGILSEDVDPEEQISTMVERLHNAGY